MNNNDERDYAEEAANRRELEDGDEPEPTDAERIASGLVGVLTLATLLMNPNAAAMLTEVVRVLRETGGREPFTADPVDGVDALAWTRDDPFTVIRTIELDGKP